MRYDPLRSGDFGLQTQQSETHMTVSQHASASAPGLGDGSTAISTLNEMGQKKLIQVEYPKPERLNPDVKRDHAPGFQQRVIIRSAIGSPVLETVGQGGSKQA